MIKKSGYKVKGNPMWSSRAVGGHQGSTSFFFFFFFTFFLSRERFIARPCKEMDGSCPKKVPNSRKAQT